MKFHGGPLVLILVMCKVSQGLLIVGPAMIRTNHKYSMVISNFNSTSVELLLTIENEKDSNLPKLTLSKSVDVRPHSNRLAEFQIPPNLPVEGSFKIVIEGQRNFTYYQEVSLVYEPRSITGLIQINKPVFKPGDTVRFRVILLDTELKPPVDVKTVSVTIETSNEEEVRKWPIARLHSGVFESQLEISPTPIKGMDTWNILVRSSSDNVLVANKTFQIQEYVLSTFKVDVIPNTVPLYEHNSLDVLITADYYFGKPAKGTVVLELILEDDIVHQHKSLTIDGRGRTNFSLSIKDTSEDEQEVNIRLTFIERVTNRTITKLKSITIYKHVYHAELMKFSEQFRPGLPFPCKIRLTYHDGNPAKNIAVQLNVDGLDDEIVSNVRTNKHGIIEKTLHPSNSTEVIIVTISVDDSTLLEKEIHRVDVVTDAYVKLELKSKIMLSKPIKVNVKCSSKMSSLVYYVVSKRNIIDHGYLHTKNQKTYTLSITATSKMMPSSKLIVATLAKDIIIYDILDIQFDDMLNNFKIHSYQEEAKPGNEIVLNVRAKSGSYVALAAYDRSLLEHNANHDLMRDDIVRVYDEFHATSENEYDKIGSIGLFARTRESLQLEGANSHYNRGGWHAATKPKELIPYRVNFLESWLWQNMTMNAQEKLNVSSITPHTTTSWYVTGFALHPTFGMGIIKRPIQLTTIQPFYIVDNLPYSLKRGEVVVLQFTLFNNLKQSQDAMVKMFNVANQIEFIESQASDRSYTKHVTVPASGSVPLSFSVRVKKVGEINVRVEAYTPAGETDAIEKVIRVLPENLLTQKQTARVINHQQYQSTTFRFNLDIDHLAEKGSVKISCSISPGFLTPVISNLDKLLDIPTGSGEGSLLHFVPSAVVLDYLNATESKDEKTKSKASALLRTGLQDVMKYRQSDGSFSMWQNEGGSVFLTAFIANALHSASKHIPDVDAAVVTKGYEWLAKKQSSSGQFVETGSVIHADLQSGSRSGISLTSYVLIAFLENSNGNKTHPDVITKGIRYIEDHQSDITDVYDMSLASYALGLYRSDSSKTLLNKLIESSTTVSGTRFWHRESHRIETTAYALLAIIQAGRQHEGIHIMNWLADQRYVTGSFTQTQETFVGLKALAHLMTDILPSKNDLTLHFTNSKTLAKTVHVQYGMHYGGLTVDIPSETKNLNIVADGLGFAVLDVKYEFMVELKNIRHNFGLTVKKLKSNEELVLKVCTSFKPTITDSFSNMVTVEVTFPSGYVVDREPIADEISHTPIKNVETRFGATSVLVYYEKMGMENNCFTITAYKRFNVVLNRPAYVLVQDYMDKNSLAIEVYGVGP